MKGIAIMTDNNVIQTKYIAYVWSSIALSSQSIGALLHIVIDNVTKNMGQKLSDAQMSETATITIGSKSASYSRGTWTSTIKPDNVTVELDCKVVEVNENSSIIVAKCGHDQWPDSVFNRIPIYVPGNRVYFGSDSTTNTPLFVTDYFSKEGSIPSSWNESILYDVGGHESSLTINNQLTIKKLPTEFVSHWVNMGAKALMGGYNGVVGYVMLVPPNGS